MRKERCYDQPSCTLKVWWEHSNLSPYDREVASELQFVLSLADNQKLEGDHDQFQHFGASVDSYIQQFLQQQQLTNTQHRVMGLQLSSVQLVDVSNAIEAFSAEVVLLPDRSVVIEEESNLNWGMALVKSILVGIISLGAGAGLGIWLAARNNQTVPRVVSTPQTIKSPEVFPETIAAAPPADLGKTDISKTTVPPPASTSPSVLDKTKKKLPSPDRADYSAPVRVYPRPEPKQVIPPIVTKQAPEEQDQKTSKGMDSVQSTAKNSNSQVEEFANSPAQNLLKEQAPQSASRAAAPLGDSKQSVIVKEVEISTSMELTQSLIEYLRSVELNQGVVTVDVNVEAGKLDGLSLENSTIGNSESLATLTEALKLWNPPPGSSGRVRIQLGTTIP